MHRADEHFDTKAVIIYTKQNKTKTLLCDLREMCISESYCGTVLSFSTWNEELHFSLPVFLKQYRR